MAEQRIYLVILLLICLILPSKGHAASDYVIVSDKEEQQIEKSRVISGDFNQVWAVVLAALTTTGYQTKGENKDSGLIVTDYLETTGSEPVRYKYRHRLNVTVAASSASSTRVTIQAEFQILKTITKRKIYAKEWQWGSRRRFQLAIEKDLFAAISGSQ